jgi:hypothetical protein
MYLMLYNYNFIFFTGCVCEFWRGSEWIVTNFLNIIKQPQFTMAKQYFLKIEICFFTTSIIYMNFVLHVIKLSLNPFSAHFST